MIKSDKEGDKAMHRGRYVSENYFKSGINSFM
jgi:hypothetical protein